MSVTYLSSADFKVVRGNSGPILTIAPQGLVLVMYYSNKCRDSMQILPVYKTFADHIRGCTFAIANAAANDNYIGKISRGTRTQIEGTPTIILYYNHYPEIGYSSVVDVANVKEFIADMSQRIHSREKNSEAHRQATRKAAPEEQKTKIPDYCLGKPNDDEDLCYLSYDSAYK